MVATNDDRTNQPTEGNPNRTTGGAPDTDRENQSGAIGSEIRSNSDSANFENRSERIFFATLIGGIIGQLASQVEDQVRESEECILWYQRRTKELKHQLAELQKLETEARKIQ